MDMNIFSSLSRLSNEHLLAEVKRLAAGEREATASLIAYLAEMDARDLHLAEGCASLFAYCTRALHLSEHAAYGRIEAARAARRFPVLLAMLASGDVNLTAVTLLGPVLTSENHRALLDEARHKSRRQIEEILARVRPQPAVTTTVRKLPERRPPYSTAASEAACASAPVAPCAPSEATTAPGAPPVVQPEPLAPSAVSASAPRELPAAVAASPAQADSASRPPRPAVVEPLSPGRYRIQFTASAVTHERLRRAQDLLRHQVPDGDIAAVVDRALRALLREIERRKFGAAAKTGASRARTRGSRYVPPAVRRAVWTRDGERCTFVGRDGQRCDERAFLEFDHRHPHADGGPATVENLRLRCRAHNRYTADLYFGPTEAPGVCETAASYAIDRASRPPPAPPVGGRAGSGSPVSLQGHRVMRK